MSKQKKEAFSSLYVECTHMHTHTKKKKEHHEDKALSVFTHVSENSLSV